MVKTSDASNARPEEDKMWSSFKSEVEKTCRFVSSSEMDKTKGDLSKLVHLIQERMGGIKEDIHHNLEVLWSRLSKDSKEN